MLFLSNAGHFNVEIDMEWLEANASEAKEARENITAYLLPDGKWINVLAEGRLVNIAASNGHPAEIMDMSFAVQALSALYVRNNKDRLENKVFMSPMRSIIWWPAAVWKHGALL